MHFNSITHKFRCPKSLMRYRFKNALIISREGQAASYTQSAARSAKSLPTITLQNIFSKENKARCQENILSVRPVRDVSWKMKGKKVEKAGVLVPLCLIQREPSILFTLRASGLSSQPREVSFPGGKKDATDPHLTYTALRETQEEIGILPASVDVWGSMNIVPGRNFLMAVTPVVGFCGELNLEVLDHNKHEVDKVFARSVASLCDPANQHYTRFRSGIGYTLPVYTGGVDRIWGLTAVITHQLLTLLAPGLYHFDIPHR